MQQYMSKHAESKYIQYMCYKQTVNQYTPSHVIPPRLSHSTPTQCDIIIACYSTRTTAPYTTYERRSAVFDGSMRWKVPYFTHRTPCPHWRCTSGNTLGWQGGRPPQSQQTATGTNGVLGECWGVSLLFQNFKMAKRKICCNHNNPRTELIHLVK